MFSELIYKKLIKKKKKRICAISSADMEVYRRTAKRRNYAAEERRRQTVRQGWDLAARAAKQLRKQFQAQRVVVFGSLLRPDHFDAHSDVDLAVWGLADKDYLKAVAMVTGLDSEITVDLIRMEDASPAIYSQVENGVEI